MPRVKIDYVVSFSSEDPDNPANNLLGWEVSKKRWLCPKGESSCSVVLQLCKSVKISAVHVGVHHVALLEVLVGRSETPHEPYQVLVPSCVVVGAAESRNSQGVERVRSFSAAALADCATQRWDRLRVVCSQPYNKHCQFGLNFVHVYEPEGKESTARKPALLTSGPDCSSDEEFRPGELFAQHRLSTSKLDTGTQIRQATSQALKNVSDTSMKLVKSPIVKAPTKTIQEKEADHSADRHKDSLMYTDEDKPHTRIDHIVQRHKDEKNKDTPTSKRSKNERSQSNDNDKDKEPSSKKAKLDKDKTKVVPNGNVQREIKKELETPNQSRESKNSTERTERRTDDSSNRKRDHNKESTTTGSTTTRLDQVLQGVVFVLSGYVNPRRSALRDKALAMGAHCRNEWDYSCTHLICAFPNTPKLRQVRASSNGAAAVVVRGEWVDACLRHTRRLPPHHYLTEGPAPPTTSPEPGDSGDTPQDEDCDTDDEIEKAMLKNKDRTSRDGHNSSPKTSTDTPSSRRLSRLQDSDDVDTDEDTNYPLKVERVDPSRSLPLLLANQRVAVGTEPHTRLVVGAGGLAVQVSELEEDSSVDFALGVPRGTSAAPRLSARSLLTRLHPSTTH